LHPVPRCGVPTSRRRGGFPSPVREGDMTDQLSTVGRRHVSRLVDAPRKPCRRSCPTDGSAPTG
jgi:hypothetical protein